jgi:polyphosphate kinase 2
MLSEGELMSKNGEMTGNTNGKKTGAKENGHESMGPRISKKAYKTTLCKLQMELVKLQRHFIECNEKILIILEGRDASGKDGTIKRIVQHLSPRETRVVALGKPSDRDRTSWYFRRYVSHLPAAQELVILNRSWYNRAGVERVMGFCSNDEYEEFMSSVLDFEAMLVRSGIKFFKYYLDISKVEQTKRLQARKNDPLKQWKVSPIDEQAVKHWKAYSLARNEMLARSHNSMVPWTLVRANDKHQARLNIIKDILCKLDYAGKNESLVQPDPQIVFPYDLANFENAQLEK